MENHLGEIRNNNHGTPMEIVRYKTNADMDVKFLDEYGYVMENTTYTNFKKGQIKNPFDKSIHGVGMLGKQYSAYKDYPVYRSWSDMIERCYSENTKDKYPAYYQICTVCDEWKIFTNFYDWYKANQYECDGRLHLDKDILFPGNKVYSPETCLLVPQKINMQFVTHPNKTNLPTGIRKVSNGYKADYYGKVCSPLCSTVEEAYKYYAKRKKEAIREVADEYKDVVPKRVYDAVISYEPRIEYDKNYQKAS